MTTQNQFSFSPWKSPETNVNLTLSAKHLISAGDTRLEMAASEDLKEKLSAINDRYAVVKIGGSVGVADLSKCPPDILNPTAFEVLYKNKKFPRRMKDKYKHATLSSLWMEWEFRREYDGGIAFAPGRVVPKNQLNLFTGFATEPSGGSWDFMEGHLRENVCDGNEEYYEWLMSWFADIVQNPGQKLGTAVCLRGRKGCGKSIVFDMFRKMIGTRYSAVISQKKHLTGSFNKHLMSALFAQVEEAVWAGDKEAEGHLKHLITGDTIRIEPKGLDTFEVESFTRFGFTTNEDWALPASADERRYFILDVSGAAMQKTDYFKRIVVQMENADGLGAWMKTLLEWQKPDWVDLRNPPKTDALGEQVLESLPVAQKFFVEAVRSGQYFNEERDLEAAIDDIYPDYVEFVQERGARQAANRQKFGHAQRAVWDFEMQEKRVNGAKTRVYTLPPLWEARQMVADNLKISIELLD
ncbi:MAG TPA: primase-helicase family protein [Kaistia sp.]|nr:primase-helicase family protein [Kaistia sp.]